MSTAQSVSWVNATVDINDDTSDAHRAFGSLGYRALLYVLSVTMEVPSAKATALAAYCGGSIPETSFLHFKYDTSVTLPVGADLPGHKHVTKVVPGWCPPPNCTVPAGKAASATTLEQARVPIYYWSPPVGDYAINPSEPCHRRFLAERWGPSQINASGTGGVWFDTMKPDGPPGAAQTAALVEFDGTTDAYFEAVRAMMREVRRHAPADSIVLANGWASEPLEIDGFERENWLNALSNAAEFTAAMRGAEAGAGTKRKRSKGAKRRLRRNQRQGRDNAATSQ